MAKAKTIFFCQDCGFESPKWLGRCASCGGWNTFVEETVVKSSGHNISMTGDITRAIPGLLAEVATENAQRIKTGISELDRILGGGIVPGSLILLGGEPGIGKSTIALQLVLSLPHLKTLYISGEESQEQIKMRAGRLGSIPEKNTYVLAETRLENIIQQIENITPAGKRLHRPHSTVGQGKINSGIFNWTY
jgi:DNA repair protein RadA/Sms